MLLVAVATGSAFDGHDLAVQPLRNGVGHAMSTKGHDVVHMIHEHVRTLPIGSSFELLAQEHHFFRKRLPHPTDR